MKEAKTANAFAKRALSRAVIFCALFDLLVSSAAAATISSIYTNDLFADGPRGNRIVISGTIAAGDMDRVRNEMALQGGMSRGVPEVVELNGSLGGDLREAMKIGRFIRSQFLRTEVTGRCASACFYIAAAGVERHVGSDIFDREAIGLHRPYFAGKEFGELSPPKAKSAYLTLQDAALGYLVEIGVPLDLAEESMRHSSEETLWLTGQEYLSRLGRAVPSIEEWLISRCEYMPWREVADARAVKWAKENLGAPGRAGEIARQLFDAFQVSESDADEWYSQSAQYTSCRSGAIRRAVFEGFEGSYD